MTPSRVHPDRSKLNDFIRSDPTLELIRERTEDQPVYLVGGAIRDSLCGFPVDDIDLVIEGDPARLIKDIDPAARIHGRFGTAELRVGERRVDLARARIETYPHPGALPVVRFGQIEDDLKRRDFTINAIAMPLSKPPGESELLDPFNGVKDLELGLLRILHPNSFRDDPTRALRAARYAARFGFGLAPGTDELLENTDLDSISVQRRTAELRLLAGEESAPAGFQLLGDWGLVSVDQGGIDLAEKAIRMLGEARWSGFVDRTEAVLTACLTTPWAAIERLGQVPESPYQGRLLAGEASSVELLLARAAGATWLDTWLDSWRQVELTITGADLVAAGVPEGPAISAALDAALRSRLDRGVSGPEDELKVALAAVRDAK